MPRNFKSMPEKNKMKTNIILEGDSLSVLKTLPDESINCVMTSPPYWALRDYGEGNNQIWDGDETCEHSWGSELGKKRNRESPGVGAKQEINASLGNICNKCGAWKGQLGLEPTFDLYIKHLCDIFSEVKRVLRKDGTCWVNLGDTYCGGHAGGSTHPKGSSVVETGGVPQQIKEGRPAGNLKDYQEKCLISIPARFQIEMINRGWILRNNIIWHKPNCMPSSVKDRFTVDFEYLFFFVKNKKYWFETQYESLQSGDWDKMPPIGGKKQTEGNFNPTYSGNTPPSNSKGRNKRTVWRICPKPFKEAHFAVFPEELCETPIKAGCPEFVCKKCGMPKVMVENIIGKQVTEGMIKAGCDKEGKYYGKEQKDYKSAKANEPSETKKRILESMSQVKEYSYKPTCNCKADFTGGIVLDPFFGAGTTGLVALKQNKKFIGIEINPEYIKIAKARIKPFLTQTKLNFQPKKNVSVEE